MKKLEFEYLPLEKIEISLSNARKTKLEEGIDELVDSIRSIGVQQPVVVIKKENTEDEYELIIGQRRYLACQRLKLREIPAIITEVEDETDLIIKSFSENIHRRDLEYRDKQRIAKTLLKKYKTASKVADVLGVSEGAVRDWLGYSQVPEEIKEMVDKGELAATTATRIAKNFPDKETAIKITEIVKKKDRSHERMKIIEIAKENPEKTADEVEEIIKDIKFTEITIYLTPRVAEGVKKACTEYSSEGEEVTPEDLAKSALEEWLSKRGFIE
ncbi:ParB/RepB/Spo0J family partition protein [candidate division WOR-3 bacterium]|nr:ParB/RepB/Spo0J family partition protein [candidate division WOR-3 bacterium]